MKKFSFQTRTENLQKLQQSEFDLVIIGGGINGAGVARDASLRGMKVALVEAHDFASGTSSRSSKLIHGGIRYLENMEFKLVFEALNERTKLFEMAPHLAHPLRFMIPLYENSRVSMFKMGLGMWLYDALSLFQTPEMHERLNAGETLSRMPMLAPGKLAGSFVYSDAYMDDDRLVHETLRSANQNGAVCVNYVKALGAQFNEQGQMQSIEVQDSLTQKKMLIKGHHFVSTVGPWTDSLGKSIFKDWQKMLRPTKGIHLTFSKERLKLDSAVVMGAENSDRIIFGIPRHEMVIIGTTDTDFKTDPDGVVATVDDVDYLLGVVSQYFPGAKIKKSDILSTYAGVRPLVKDNSSTEGKTSREHTILNDPRGITFVAGGKYTTYRLMSEQIVDSVLKFFSIEDRVKFKDANTAVALNEWTDIESYERAQQKVQIFSKTSLLKYKEVQKLVDRYGLEVEEIFQQHPETLTYWQLEAHQAIDTTMCLNLVDFYSRRVPLFLSLADHGLSHLKEISQIFQERLNLSEAQLNEQIEALRQHINSEMAWRKI